MYRVQAKRMKSTLGRSYCSALCLLASLWAVSPPGLAVAGAPSGGVNGGVENSVDGGQVSIIGGGRQFVLCGDYLFEGLDTDGDVVADTCDNCPADYNPDQLDTDEDGVGDACEPDENRPPVTAPDVVTTSQGTSIDIDVLDNDYDPDNDPLLITIPSGAIGEAVVNDNGTPDEYTDDFITYTPPVAFTGEGSFVYAVDDGRGGTQQEEVIIWVNSNVNGAPQIISPGDQFNVEEDEVSLEIQAIDPDGDALTYSVEGLPPGLSSSASGSIFGTLLVGTADRSPYLVLMSVSDGTTTVGKLFVWTIDKVLEWDEDGKAPVDGGAGLWTLEDARWYNGTGYQKWDPEYVAKFGGTAGKVEISQTIQLGTRIHFASDGYNLVEKGFRNPRLQLAVGTRFQVDKDKTATINAIISGKGKLYMSSPGTLVLRQPNEFSGGTRFTSGTLVLYDKGTLGKGVVEMEPLPDEEAKLLGDLSAKIENDIKIPRSQGKATLGGGDLVHFAGRIIMNKIKADDSPEDVEFSASEKHTVRFSGEIEGQSRLVKTGKGTVSLSRDGLGHTYKGGTVVRAGTLDIYNAFASSATGTGMVTVESEGTLRITLKATIDGPLVVKKGGKVENYLIGSFGCRKSVTFEEGSTFHVEVDGMKTGHIELFGNRAEDRTIDLGNATLDFILFSAPARGEKHFIVRGASKRTGHFKNLPPGLQEIKTLAGTPYKFKVSYEGNAATGATTGGNDVVLEYMP